MIPPFWQRMRERLCRWFGHRPVIENYTETCRRCGWLLRGPLQLDPKHGSAPTHEGPQ